MATTIDLTPLVLSADGTPAADGTTLGKLLSNDIMGSSINDEPMKYFEWALDLRKTGVIVVDSTDKEKLVNLITNSTGLNVLGKGRLLEAIRNASDTAKSAPAPAPAQEVYPNQAEVQPEQQVSDIQQEAT